MKINCYFRKQEIPKINCYFCKQEIPGEPLDIAKGIIKYNVCPTCPQVCTTSYATPYGEKDIIMASIHFEYRDRYYKASYAFPRDIFYIKMIKDLKNEEATSEVKMVMSLPFIPQNITPHNILKKIPTLIVFS